MAPNHPPSAAKRQGDPSKQLMALPEEMKVMILRHPLIAPNHTIARTSDYPVPAQFGGTQNVSGFGLHPQILSTCQVLYRIGKQILEDENTLHITLRRVNGS